MVWTQLRRSGVVNKQNDLYVGVARSLSLGLQVGALAGSTQVFCKRAGRHEYLDASSAKFVTFV